MQKQRPFDVFRSAVVICVSDCCGTRDTNGGCGDGTSFYILLLFKIPKPLTSPFVDSATSQDSLRFSRSSCPPMIASSRYSPFCCVAPRLSCLLISSMTKETKKQSGSASSLLLSGSGGGSVVDGSPDIPSVRRVQHTLKFPRVGTFDWLLQLRPRARDSCLKSFSSSGRDTNGHATYPAKDSNALFNS